jgi:hypothetical protein
MTVQSSGGLWRYQLARRSIVDDDEDSSRHHLSVAQRGRRVLAQMKLAFPMTPDLPQVSPRSPGVRRPLIPTWPVHY